MSHVALQRREDVARLMASMPDIDPVKSTSERDESPRLHFCILARANNRALRSAGICSG
jgi:hypothetical protein